MPDNPQRPTERMAFYEVLTTEPTQTIGNPGHTMRVYKGPRHQIEIMHTPLWFDPDEDVEIEDPADEAPDTDE